MNSVMEEALVLVHGTLVAVYQGNGLWPMFFFGFAAMIVLTQMHGLGLSPRVRWLMAAVFVIGTGLFYGLSSDLRSDLVRINEVIRIPAIEYGAVFLFYAMFLDGYGLTRWLRRAPTPAERTAKRSVRGCWGAASPPPNTPNRSFRQAG